MSKVQGSDHKIMCSTQSLRSRKLWCQEHRIHGGDERFTVHLDDAGKYNVLVHGKVWLAGLPAFVTINHERHSVNDGTLTYKTQMISSGTDNLGAWNSVTYVYEHSSSGAQIGLGFRAYQGYTMAVMYQEFYTGLRGTSVGKKHAVCTSFPSFSTTPGQEDLGFLAYGGIMVGDTKKHIGRWGNAKDTAQIASGLDSGPLVLFNHDNDAVIISPFTNFMSASAAYDTKNNTVSWGLLGNATNVPAGFQYATIIFYSSRGIQRMMQEWGEVMRRYYGRTTTYTEADMTNNYIGYWTDNGAYYYYLTEAGKNYEQTLIDYLNYSQAQNIPYRYVQYDSWWYPKGQFLGVTEWVAMPEVFPHGLQTLYNKLSLPVVAHNRFWSDKNVYAKQNGGKYNFIVEPHNHLAIPTDQNFWDFLMASSKLWGLVTYEQDWLNQEFDDMDATTSDVLLGKLWLMQMGKGAAKAGLNIQYCMSPSRHILQALEINVVTQARVSDDYQPGNENWRIGISSMFAHAIGVAPFKDNFWTTEQQPGNVYNGSEPHSLLQSVVATLSAGPVGPGDMINHSDPKLIMRSCNADGLILKPSRPAFAIDAQIKQAAFKDGSGPEGEVWSTYSEISGYLFGIILAAAMPDGTSYKLGPTQAMFQTVFPQSKIFAANPTRPSATDFSDTNPVLLQGCTKTQPCVYYTTPVFSINNQELVLYGEVSKWVPMSRKRVNNIGVSEYEILLDLRGAVGEHVEITWTVDNTWQQQACTISQDGTALLSLISKSCISLNP